MKRGSLLLGAGALLLAGAAGFLLLGGGEDAPTSPPSAAPRAAGDPGRAAAPPSAPGPADPAAAPRPAGRAVLLGLLVRSRTRAPLAGAVAVAAPGGARFAAAAGPGGGFRIEGLPAGVPLEVEATAEGCLPWRAPALRLPGPGEHDLGFLVLGAGVPLEVRVSDTAGAPVPGAAVTLRRPGIGRAQDFGFDAGPPLEAAAADEAGVASFPAAPPGFLLVEAGARGLSTERTGASLEEGALREPVHLVLSPACALEGRVLDAAGAPMKGVAVLAARSEDSWWSENSSRGTGVSDAAGRYRIEALGAGVHHLAVRAFPSVTEQAGAVPVAGETRHDIRLGPRAGLRGRVLDGADGSPVPGAAVAIDYRRSESLGGFAEARTATDAAGAFLLEGLPAGPLSSFSVRAEGFVPFPGPGDPPDGGLRALEEGAAREMEIRLARGARVRGTVRFADGRPVPNAWVTLEQERPDGNGYYGETRADGAGGYVLEGVPPGRARFRAGGRNGHLPGMDEERAPDPDAPSPSAANWIEVPASGEVLRDLLLVPDARVEGRMAFADGRPAAGLTPVLVQVGDGEGEEWEAEEGPASAADGTFVLEDMTPGAGRYFVAANGPSGRLGAGEPFVLEESTALSGVLVTVREPAALEGIVRGPDGKPVAGGVLRLVPRRYDEEGSWMWERGLDGALRRPLAAGGSFRVEGLGPGPWTPVASAPGCLDSRGESVDLGEGEVRGGIIIDLEAERFLAGRVTDPGGRPVAGAEVTATPEPEEVPGMDGEEGQEEIRALLRRRVLRRASGGDPARVLTDAAGAFRIGGLGEGRHAVLARAKGFAPGEAKAEAGDLQVALSLLPGVSLRGRAVEEGSTIPVPGLTVGLSARRVEGPEPEDGMTTTGPDGTFLFDGLPAGSYDVALSDPSQRWVAKTVRRIPAGGKEVVIEVVRGLVLAGRAVAADGSPLDTTGLMVRTTGKDGNTHWENLGADGSFRREGLPPGRVTVTVGPMGWGEEGAVHAARTVAAEAGTTDLVVPLPRGKPIRGRLQFPPGVDPSEDAEVVVRPSRGGEEAWVEVGADGSFTTQALEVGVPQDLLATWEEKGLFGEAREVMPGVAGVVVRLEPGLAIAGRVLDPDGAPLAGAAVEAEGPSGAEEAWAESGADGGFVMEGLRPGRSYRLSASSIQAGLAPLEPTPPVEAGATGVEVRTAKGHSLRVRFLEPDGSVPELGAVWVQRTVGKRSSVYTWGVDEEGILLLGGLPPCQVRVKAFRSGEPFDFEEAPEEGGDGWEGPFEVPGPDRTITLRK